MPLKLFVFDILCPYHVQKTQYKIVHEYFQNIISIINNNDYIALNNDKMEQLPNLGIILKPMFFFLSKKDLLPV